MKTATQKLIETLKANAIVTQGKESIATDGTRYRYDRIELKYNSATNWLVNMFYKAAVENGQRATATSFFVGDTSFYFYRPQFVGQPNGKIIMSELIEY